MASAFQTKIKETQRRPSEVRSRKSKGRNRSRSQRDSRVKGSAMAQTRKAVGARLPRAQAGEVGQGSSRSPCSGRGERARQEAATKHQRSRSEQTLHN